MTVYSVIYTKTDSHNFITETQIKGIYLDQKEAIDCFNGIKLQIMLNDPKYKIAIDGEHIIDWDRKFVFWVYPENSNPSYYEVTLRIIQSTIVNKKGENK